MGIWKKLTERYGDKDWKTAFNSGFMDGRMIGINDVFSKEQKRREKKEKKKEMKRLQKKKREGLI